MDRAGPIRAEVILRTGAIEIALGDIRPTVRCGLALVDQLARLQLAAKQHGWSIRLLEVDDEVAGLLALVGLDGVLS